VATRPGDQPPHDHDPDRPIWVRRWTRYSTAADRLSHGLLHHLAAAWQAFSIRDLHQAASLAYYAVFSLFPLLMLTVSIASALFGADAIQQQVIKLAQRFFPGETQAIVEPYITVALAQETVIDLVAVVGLLWSASSLFANLSRTLDVIFRPTGDARRALWRNRLLGVGMMGGLAVLLVAVFLGSLGFRLIGTALLERPGSLMRVWSVLVPIGLDMGILILLFRFVPQTAPRWKALVPAALAGSLGWELSKTLFVWYLETVANINVVYGSLGTVVALMLWAYLSAALLLLSAEICVAIDTWLSSSPDKS